MVDILACMSMINFMLSWVEHQSFKTSMPDSFMYLLYSTQYAHIWGKDQNFQIPEL